MTRPERKPRTRPQPSPSSSSKPKPKNPFAVFEFKASDAKAEKADAKNAKKFGINQTEKKKKKKTDSVSPFNKYKFLQYFTRGDVASKKEVHHNPIDVDAEVMLGDGASMNGVYREPIDVDTEVEQDEKISKTDLHCEIVDLDDNSGGVAQQHVCREIEDFDRKEVDERDNIFVSTSNYGMESNNMNKRGRAGRHLSSTSIFVDLDTEVPSEERAPVDYDDRQRIDNTNSAVTIYPDFIFYGDSNYKGSRLIFSTSFVKLEGLSLSGTGSTVNFEWSVYDITRIESTWCERVQTAIVNLHFKLKDSKGAEITKGNSGIKGLKFAVYDPHWSERQRAIKSLSSLYKGTWRKIFDIDAEEDEDSLEGYSSIYLSGHQLTDSIEHFEIVYPEGKPEAVTIRGRDIELLQPKTFINDSIIDFYIQYLKNKIPPEEEHRFHFFNCFFFKKLVGLDNNPSTVGKEREAFQRVRKWTKNVDLFEKDYIFMPVNYSLHWSLIVICHPGEAASLKDKDIENLPKNPCILHMDSIRGSHRGLRNPVQSYLRELWKEMHDMSTEEFASEYPQLPFVELELPQQENSFDCGIFLLHYVERFLEEVLNTFSPFTMPKSRNFLKRNWFLPEEASLKRAHICNIIYYIHESYSQNTSFGNCSRSPKAVNTNKLGRELNNPEKRNILMESCHDNSVSDAEHAKEILIVGASHRSAKFGKNSPSSEFYDSGLMSRETCLDEDHDRKTAVDCKSNCMLHSEEAEESGMQVSESTMATSDCEIIAYSPQHLSRGISGEESLRHQGFSMHMKDSENGDSPPQKADEIKLERTKEIGYPPAAEELANCVVQDSQDEDHMQYCSETKSPLSLFRVTSCTPPQKEVVSLDIIDLTADCMLSS